jgi:hypothetical protein
MRFPYLTHLYRENAQLVRRRRVPGLAVRPTRSNNQWLRVSDNGRCLVDTRGAPLLLICDSPQGMLVDISTAEMATYMANRAGYGFNCLQVHLTAGSTFGGRSNRTTYDGIAPFTTAGDISTPNSTYFARVDTMLDLANTCGLLVMLTAAEYIDSQALFTSAAACRTFGQYLGARYAACKNIIWNYGNDFQDWETEPTKVACFAAVCDGIKDTAPHHLHTAWLDYFISASRDSSDWDSRIDLDFGYSYYPNYDQMLDQRALNPSKPVFMAEANYEGESVNPHGYTTTALHTRKQNYWALLSGGCGTTYCNQDIWHFSSGWESRLDSFAGAAHTGYLATLFRSFNWWDLAPDSGHAVMTAGYGTYADGTSGSIDTNTYAVGARTSDGRMYLAYLPTAREVTIAMSQIAGSTALCRWFDPTSGAYTTIGTYDCTGTRNFTPSSGDWVLRIDKAG